MKLAFRINLLFTGIVCCILLGMAFLIFSLSRGNVRKGFRDRLQTRAARAAYLYDVFRNDTTNFLKTLDANTPPVLQNKNIAIYDTSFNQRYDFHDSTVEVVEAKREWLEDAKSGNAVFRKFGRNEVGIFAYPTGLIVMVAAEDIAGRAYINDLRQIFLIYFPAAVLVTLFAGYLFSRNIVRPIRQTIHEVSLISSQNLSHRLFVGKRKDELAQLNQTFNALLNRLEESSAMEKRFISNASHELSTPLTSVSSQIEVALLQDRSIGEYKVVLTSLLGDTKDLHQLVHNLLEIARAGGQGAIALEKLRIDEVLVKSHSDVLHQHPDYKVELSFPDLPENELECQVFGNVHLLQSAFKNLIENGCKYSPDHRVRIELHFFGTKLRITFFNHSAPLAMDEIERMLEPFYRGSNAGDQPGTGLGLTLTRRIIALHKGTLTINPDTNNGTTIDVVLPTLLK